MMRSALPPSGELTLLGDCVSTIDDIRLLLARKDMEEAALRSAILSAIGERLPVPETWVRPGSTWGEVAVMIADQLRARPGPAAVLFSQLAGEPIRVQSGQPGDTTLTEGLAAALDADPGTSCWHRSGRDAAAFTELDLIPGRVPPRAVARIRSGEPCGLVLGDFGMRRQARDAEPTGSDPAVEASALLRIGEVTIGRAAERVPLSFCKPVAARA